MKSVYVGYNPATHQIIDPFKYCPYCRAELETKIIDRFYRKICPDCGFIHYRNPLPAVSVLIIDNGKVVLGKRKGDPGKGNWSIPSGYIEYEEDFLNTAVREAKEETGLDVAITSVLHISSAFLSPDFHFLGIYVLAEVIAGKLEAGDDLETIAWFPIQGPLPEMAFDQDEEIIREFAAGKIDGITVN